MQATPIKLKAETKAAISKIITDGVSAAQFIGKAEQASAEYLRLRRVAQPGLQYKCNRRRLESLQKAAHIYRMLLRTLSSGDTIALAQHSRCSGSRVISYSDLCFHTLQVLNIENVSKTILATAPRHKGRYPDGPGILLIQWLAEAFECTGHRVSGGDRSRFVRAVEALNRDAGYGFNDVRQKIRDALTAISNLRNSQGAE